MIITDEMTNILTVGDRKWLGEVADAHARIARTGRTAGMALVTGVQSGRADTLGGPVREQYPMTIAHRVRDVHAINVALGPGARGEGVELRGLPKGRAWMTASGKGYREVQIFLADSMPPNPGADGPTQVVRPSVPGTAHPAAPVTAAPLPGNEIAVLEALQKAGGWVRPSEVTLVTGISSGTVSKVCARLAIKVLVERRAPGEWRAIPSTSGGGVPIGGHDLVDVEAP